MQYLNASVATAAARTFFIDHQHELSAGGALADASKVPREIISELFEASQVSKFINQRLPDFEFKEKASVGSAEVVAYLRAVVTEMSILTFTREKQRISKLLSKLHRYLVGNLPAYRDKCSVTVPEVAEETDAASLASKEFIKASQCSSQWFDSQGQKSTLFYVLGACDPTMAKPELDAGEGEEAVEITEEQRQALVQERLEEATVHCGNVEVEAGVLSKLYQDAIDLTDEMRASEKMSAEKNERDRKYYKDRYHELIKRLGNCFKAPVMSEEDLEKDIDCLGLVQDVIPELTVENVHKLALVLAKDRGCSQSDPHMNIILRRFHRVRYAR